MQFSLVLISSLIASATAAVIELRDASPTLEKRRFLEVIMCKDLNLAPGPTGGCTSIVTANGGCYGGFSVLSKDGGNWDNTVTSAFPAYEGGTQFHCILYEHPQCTGREVRLTGPAFDLRQQNFDDIASSTRCFTV